MRLEGLVTCLDYSERRNPVESRSLLGLVDVFRQLDVPPSRFVIYFELRRNGGDPAAVSIRCRRPGDDEAWYESWEELSLTPEDAWSIPFVLEDVEPPLGRSVIEVLINGRVAGTRVVQFGHDHDGKAKGNVLRLRK